ncbi:MAG: hypothetical protein AB7F88_04970 [Pyrinomonadaceae bacterium]
MPTPWMDAVKRTKQLTVFPTARVAQGPWGAIFTQAMQEFNRISAEMNIGVTLVRSDDPPEANGFGGANVSFDVGNGAMNFTVLGNDLSVSVAGSSMHGHTQLAKSPNARTSSLEVIKAFTFVPATPMLYAGPPRRPVRRGAGNGIKLVIAVHELVHACGLSNADHSPGAEPDIFIGQPQPVPGSRPEDDKLLLRIVAPNNIFAPPNFLTGRTAGLIRTNWS